LTWLDAAGIQARMLRLAVVSVLVVLASCIVPTGTVYRSSPGYSNQQSECRMGADGMQACGYGCKIGADGVAACANAPGGTCAMGADGHVYCSETNVQQSQVAAPAQCHLNSDGSQSCGYNCKFGSDGHHYCASTPNGRCAFNSDGTWTCM
jgi:hypothetical protein